MRIKVMVIVEHFCEIFEDFCLKKCVSVLTHKISFQWVGQGF